MGMALGYVHLDLGGVFHGPQVAHDLIEGFGGFCAALWRVFPDGTSGKEPSCQCKRHKKCKFAPWVRKIPWRRAWQPTPVILAWRIPWTEEPGGLQSTGLQGVRHN